MKLIILLFFCLNALETLYSIKSLLLINPYNPHTNGEKQCQEVNK